MPATRRSESDPKNFEVQRSQNRRARSSSSGMAKPSRRASDLLTAGHKSPDLLGLRGLAKSRRSDFSGAIEDYTLALAARPDDPMFHSRRGWAYLVTGAYQLARTDFEEAIRLDPASGDAYGGRGFARAALGQYHEAVLDAEESLRHGDAEVHMVYTAARTMAQAAQAAAREPRRAASPICSPFARIRTGL